MKIMKVFSNKLGGLMAVSFGERPRLAAAGAQYFAHWRNSSNIRWSNGGNNKWVNSSSIRWSNGGNYKWTNSSGRRWSNGGNYKWNNSTAKRWLNGTSK